jgi:dihydropteroate synthase
VPSPLALDFELNIRCFLAGSSASEAAALERISGPAPADLGAWNSILENVPTLLASTLTAVGKETGVSVHYAEPRLWLSGSYAGHLRLAESLLRCAAEAGRELHAACEAAWNTLRMPPRPLVMGILNVTPDSFSDGGLWLDEDAAVARGLRMVEEGADILDIGGESTRPGAEAVSSGEELRRVLPVLKRLRAQCAVLLSIDTQKASVAERCLQAGADWINDVSGLTYDPHLAEAVSAHPEAKLVLMHCRRRASAESYSTEYDSKGQPVYEDVVADSMRRLRLQAELAVGLGVKPENLWIDPGFGFGKTPEQNLELLRRLREYTSIGLPILIGTSRKSTVGWLLGGLPPEDRLEGTLATSAWAVSQGAAAVRVHDVKETARVVRVSDALR